MMTKRGSAGEPHHEGGHEMDEQRLIEINQRLLELRAEAEANRLAHRRVEPRESREAAPAPAAERRQGLRARLGHVLIAAGTALAGQPGDT